MFTTTEEYLGYLREKYFPSPRDANTTPVDPKRTSWRKGPAHVEDGMLAGSFLTFFAGLACELTCAGQRMAQSIGGARRSGRARRIESLTEWNARGADDTVRLPNPLLIRGVLVGFTLGAIFSGGLIVQDKLAYSIRKREAADAAAAEEEEKSAIAVPASPTSESEADKDKDAALAGSSVADAAGGMGWMDWAMFKSGLGGDKGEGKTSKSESTEA